MKQNVQNQNGAQSQKSGNPYVGLLVGVLIVLALNGLVFPNFMDRRVQAVDYGRFIECVDSGLVSEVAIENGEIYFSVDRGNNNVSAYHTGEIDDPELVDRLLQAKGANSDGKIAFRKIVPKEDSPLLNFILMWILPGIVFYLIWKFTSRSIQSRLGGGGNFMSFGSSGAKIYADSDIKTTFADVAGQDEAKGALAEIVDFLHNPSKYTDIGASLPKGALLVGPPGTGKTLIARAVAGEAKVPFFAI